MGFAFISTELLPARHAGDGPGAPRGRKHGGVDHLGLSSSASAWGSFCGTESETVTPPGWQCLSVCHPIINILGDSGPAAFR
jgi:hypothetical protein